VTTGRSDADIAILDTGIDQRHKDLAGKIAASHNFTKSRTLNDKVGHGTHVAGSAAALTNNSRIGVAGTCPECLPYNVKVVGDDGTGTLSSLASGITWSANNGAEVINMSLGSTSGSRTLRDAVDYAWGKGVLLVAAAGNYSTKAPFYPAYYDHVIAVAATNDKDAKPKFSDYGTWVDVAAPGVNILSTWPHNRDHPDGRYKYLSGTSMATPHVAGVAGLVWSTNLCAASNNTCVRDRIESTADQIPGTGTFWTYGRINAYKAVAPP
jgi:thermitase